MSSLQNPAMASPNEPFEARGSATKTKAPKLRGMITKDFLGAKHGMSSSSASGTKKTVEVASARGAMQNGLHPSSSDDEAMDTLAIDGEIDMRRSSLPPIPQSRDSHVTINTTPEYRHSMSEVVARMEEREKTLLGDDLLQRRDKDPRRMSVREDRRFSTFSIVTIVNDDGTIKAEYARPTPQERKDSLALSQGPKFTRTVYSRRTGVRELIPAWGTPRKRPRGSNTPGSSPGVYFRTGPAEQDIVPEDYGPVVSSESPLSPDTQAIRDFDIDDDYFDYDRGEDQLVTEREAQRKSKDIEPMYHRACERLGIRPSLAFLRQCTITCVTLRAANLSASDVKAISIVLVRDKKVRILDLSYNNLGALGVSYIAEMLQANVAIQDVDLSGTNPERAGVRALSETLRFNSTITRLRLEDNRIEHTESEYLAEIMRNVPSLQGLFLGNNNLGYLGGTAIAAAMTQNNTMLTLDLQWNHIRKNSAKVICRALEHNEYIRTLNLSWNGLGKEGCLALAYSLPENVTLRELDISCNRIDLQALAFLLHAVCLNRVLRTLKMGHNPLTTEGVKAMITAIGNAKDCSVTHIDITGIPVDTEFVRILKKIQETRELTVKHDPALSLSTVNRKKDFEGTELDRYDPLLVLFEYMKLDNLRIIDMFQYMDTKKREKLSKGNIRDGLVTLRIPLHESAIDTIFKGMDLNKDGFVTLDEMVKMARVWQSIVTQRTIKAKQKKKEDKGLKDLHNILKNLIKKRKEDNEAENKKKMEDQRKMAEEKEKAEEKKKLEKRMKKMEDRRRSSGVPGLEEGLDKLKALAAGEGEGKKKGGGGAALVASALGKFRKIAKKHRKANEEASAAAKLSTIPDEGVSEVS
ncbi:hypothetical protein V1264_004494 [Littorina saxatilis]|uniref:EF-hand domain-containing protein n=2 Tax=Littorina saxatilis TaxID=31220 RepID=A0AAN9G7H5_9CAEN